jgi:hypothetical protein
MWHIWEEFVALEHNTHNWNEFKHQNGARY